jgi:hypothetical protein
METLLMHENYHKRYLNVGEKKDNQTRKATNGKK